MLLNWYVSYSFPGWEEGRARERTKGESTSHRGESGQQDSRLLETTGT